MNISFKIVRLLALLALLAQLALLIPFRCEASEQIRCYVYAKVFVAKYRL